MINGWLLAAFIFLVVTAVAAIAVLVASFRSK